jgi:hypothetical protein
MRLTLRKTWICVALLAASAGCKKKIAADADASADTDATAAAPAAVSSAAEATNSDNVARFPEETKIDHVAAKIEEHQAIARNSPPGGDVVATLPHGTEVTEIAQHGNFFLVTFDNPKDKSAHLMGWVSKDAFSPQHAVVKQDGGAAAAASADAAAVAPPGALPPFLAKAGPNRACPGGFVFNADTSLCHKSCPPLTACDPGGKCNTDKICVVKK